MGKRRGKRGKKQQKKTVHTSGVKGASSVSIWDDDPYDPKRPIGHDWDERPYGASPRASARQPYSGAYGGYGGGWASRTEPVKVGTIAVTDKDGKPRWFKTVEAYYRDWWEIACGVEGFQLQKLKDKQTGKEQEFLLIPESCVNFSEGNVSFFPCTYDAAKSYMEAMYGRKLHETDKEWLARHPLATDDGIPMAATATAMQALLEPYGFGVSRIRMRAGKLAAGDEIMRWMQVLGCNPFGMVDHKTTNTEAAEKLGMSVAEAEQLFRFEFHEDPLYPSLVGERGWTSGNGVQTGGSGGHAKYLPPRGREGNWVISVQFAPLSEITYLTPPELPEYIPRSGAATFYMTDISRPDGTKVGEWKNGKYCAPGTAEQGEDTQVPFPNLLRAADDDGLEDLRPKSALIDTDSGVCQICLNDEILLTFADVCADCWSDQLVGLVCPNKDCKHDLGAGIFERDLPSFSHWDEELGLPMFACSECGTHFYIPADHYNENVAELYVAIADALKMPFTSAQVSPHYEATMADSEDALIGFDDQPVKTEEEDELFHYFSSKKDASLK